MHKSLKNDNGGVALITVIMVMLVLFLLVAATLNMTTSNVRNSIEEREFQASYYIAEAGVNYGAEYFKPQILEIYNNSSNPSEFFNNINIKLIGEDKYTTKDGITDPDIKKIGLNLESQYGSQPEVQLSLLDVTEDPPPSPTQKRYKLVSKGTLNDTSRIATKEFVVQWVTKETTSSNLDFAIYTSNNITIDHPNAKIEGPIAAGGKIIFGKGTINGDYATAGGVVDKDNKPVAPSAINGEEGVFTPHVYNSPSFQEYDNPANNIHINTSDNTLTLEESSNYITNGSAGHNKDIVVKYSKNKNVLVVDRVDFNNVNRISLDGDGIGILQVVVRVSSASDVPGVINKISAKFAATDSGKYKVAIYYTGNEKLEIKHNNINSSTVNASLYIKGGAENAVILETHKVTFNGNIIVGSGNIDVKGGNEEIFKGMIYAPNSNIESQNHALFNGPIVAKNFDFNNKVTVTYNPSSGQYQIPSTSDPISNTDVLIPEENISPVREK